MAEPIEIIIRKGSSGEGTGFGIPGAEVKDIEKSSSVSSENTGNLTAVARRAGSAISAFALASAKKYLSYGISQYGNVTGNYIQQAEIELQLQYVNDAISVGGGIIAGAHMGSVGGPIGAVVGAVVGGTIAVGNIAENYSLQKRTLQTNIAKLNTYHNVMQERSGNSYNNGSRGTYQ